MSAGVVVDVAIVLILVLMTLSGFRSGVLKAGSALTGLVLGLALAIPLTSYVGRQVDSEGVRLGVVVGLLVLLANAGYLGGLLVGERLRKRVRGRLAAGVDGAAGALLSAILAVLLVWTIGMPLAASPLPWISKQVRGSAILPVIDQVMPDEARAAYDAIEAAIADQGLPDILGPLQQTDVADVGAPNPASVQDPQVHAASASVVKVIGAAPQCSRQVNGSGFVYADGRVATNAHVVAGTSSLKVLVGSERHDATVVYADEGIDVAVLKVDGLTLPPLALDPAELAAGTDVVVAGFPGGGPKSLGAAKVRATGDVSGPTFRETATITREVVALRGSVVGGNSGGPLLDLDGEVVGLIFAAAVDEPDVGYALSVDQIDEALAAGAQASGKVQTGACYP